MTGGPDLAQLLTQLGGADDPRLELVAKLLSQRGDAEEEVEERRAEEERLERARRRARRLRDAFELLRARNHDLAQALGACVCWGDPRCGVCRGAGTPGSSVPDEERFERYVLPVLRRIGLVRDAGSSPTLPTDDPRTDRTPKE